MKTIKFDPLFHNASGQPFPIPDPDATKQLAAKTVAKAAKEATYQPPLIMEPTFTQVMMWFINNMPHEQLDTDKEGKVTQQPRKLTVEDTGNGYAAIKAFQAAGDKAGKVALEDAVHTWLLELVKTDGPVAFHMTQAVVKERLENLVPDKAEEGSK